MKIVVINATEHIGCTAHMRDVFLSQLPKDNEIISFFLPRDMPYCCIGCKRCFLETDGTCPHEASVKPIWEALCAADLLVIPFPVYVSGMPGQLKSLLDHLACHHMVHQPDQRMFLKRAVVLSQSLRSSNKKAQNEVRANLTWLGIPQVRALGANLKEGYTWEELSPRRRANIEGAVKRLAAQHQNPSPVKSTLRIKLLFALCRSMMQKRMQQKPPLSADARYWLEQGWLRDAQ